MTLQCLELESVAEPQYSVIWLHGLGATANDFVPIVTELALPKECSVRFVFPQAPERAVTINAGYIMPAWYDILHISGLKRHIDHEGLMESVQQIHQLIDRECRRGIAPDHIFVAGFSQGGAIAYMAGLTYTKKLAGIIGLSTYIPEPVLLKNSLQSVQNHVPLLIIHGTHDGVVPYELGQAAFEELESWGFEPQWYEYPMQHEVNHTAVVRISNWLQQQMEG